MQDVMLREVVGRAWTSSALEVTQALADAPHGVLADPITAAAAHVGEPEARG
jgi:hypothetical protein